MSSEQPEQEAIQWSSDREPESDVAAAIAQIRQQSAALNFENYLKFNNIITGLHFEIMRKIAEANPAFPQQELQNTADLLLRSSLRFHGLSGSGVADSQLQEKAKALRAKLGDALADSLMKEVHDRLGVVAKELVNNLKTDQEIQDFQKEQNALLQALLKAKTQNP